MAIDEAIMQAVARGAQPATLRVYRWSPPALSLGYSQPVSDVDRDRLASRGWDLVRRPTGGRAILHTDELTYSFCAGAEGRFFRGGILASYQRLSRGLEAGLRLLGLPVESRAGDLPTDGPEDPVCFGVPSAFELTLAGRKVCGSAQVRRREVALQHGTIPLDGDYTRIVEVLRFPDGSGADQARDRLEASAISLSIAAGRPIAWDEAARAIIAGFAAVFDLELHETQLSAAELAALPELEAKHASAGWHERV